jgi:hypothetical protein
MISFPSSQRSSMAPAVAAAVRPGCEFIGSQKNPVASFGGIVRGTTKESDPGPAAS